MIRFTDSSIVRENSFNTYENDLNIGVYCYPNVVEIRVVIYEGKDVYSKEYSFHKFNIDSRDCFYRIWKKLRPKFRYEHEWIDFRKVVRKIAFKPEVKCWEMSLPENIVLWASRKLQEIKDTMKERCVDNYRVAKIGNTPQNKRYRRQIKKGCCGFLDITELCPIDGNVYRLGFNYGH